MSSSNRAPGFWAEVGVVYDAEQSGPNKLWQARLPGSADITGRGRTKRQALAELKSAHARFQHRERPAERG